MLWWERETKTYRKKKGKIRQASRWFDDDDDEEEGRVTGK